MKTVLMVAALTAATSSFGQLTLPLVTVLQFGAIPNDGADDTDAMQRAADYLSAHPGTTLIYPPGIYNIIRTVDWETEYIQTDPPFRGKAVVYANLRDVKILGVGAVIDVNGDFQKSVSAEHPQPDPENFPDLYYADTFPFNPFLFIDSSHFTLAGFEIRGNVDRTTQADPSRRLLEADGHGVWTARCHDYVLERLNIHHMQVDGLSIEVGAPQGYNVTIRHVISANNLRTGLALFNLTDALVEDSDLRDTGVVGTLPNSYRGYPSLPRVGVDVESEVWPEDADWVRCDAEKCYRTPGVTGMNGNILFNRVRITGNLGGGISVGHPSNVANVTVRNSFLQNPIGEASRDAKLLYIGIPGGVVENSVLDVQMGTSYVRQVEGHSLTAQYQSAKYREHLEKLAADPSPGAQSIYRETRGAVSTTFRGNTFRGQSTLLTADFVFPFLDILDNDFQGSPSDTNRPFFLLINFSPLSLPLPNDRPWTPVTRIEGNRFFLPDTAPRHPSSSYGYGEIYSYGVTHFERNEYTTNASAARPFHVSYGQVETVVNDRFPTNGSIIPIPGPSNPPVPQRPYALSPAGDLNIPQ